MSATRLLAFSDLHADEEALDALRAISMRGNYDAIICAGDITNRGPVSYAQDLFDLFDENLYFVHGNMDSASVVDLMRPHPGYLHGRKAELGEWNLVGLGGSNQTPFNTPSELSESSIETILKNAGVDEFSILVSHPPPKGHFDQVGDMHVGSSAVLNIIEQRKPLMAICGHIHEQEGQKIVGQTLLVKLGAANAHRAAEIEISNGIKVKFISF